MRKLIILAFLLLFVLDCDCENKSSCALHGLVYDTSDNPVKDAVIKLTKPYGSTGGSESYMGITNSSGWYVIDGINMGVYNVNLSREGYESLELSSMKFTLREIKNRDFIIKPANVPMTLIITNRNEFLRLHADSELAYPLMESLQELAEYPPVSGNIIFIDEIDSINRAFNTWKQNQFDPVDGNHYANEVCKLVKNQIQKMYLMNAPDRYKYILIIGDDRIVPHYRENISGINFGEDNYLSKLAEESTIKTALAEDYTLTDDFYGDLKNDPKEGKWGIYIPIMGVGRLVETPENITRTILSYLESDNRYESIGIYGSSYLKELSDYIESKSDGLRRIYSIIGDDEEIWSSWNEYMLSRKSDVLIMNLHANHYEWESPASFFNVLDVLTSEDSFTGSIVYAPGCHSGLCVPPENPNFEGLDLIQSFLSKGTLAYIGNTGYSFGYENSIGLSERILQIFFTKLNISSITSVSEALRKAKLGYILESFRPDGKLDKYDQKVLYDATLYGLPMAMIQNKNYENQQSTEKNIQEKSPEYQRNILKYKRIDLDFGFGDYGKRWTGRGNFYSYKGFNSGRAYSFARPLYSMNWRKEQSERAKDSFVLSGKTVKEDTEPYMNVPMNEYYEDPQPLPSSDEWESPVLAKINTFDDDESLVVITAMIEKKPGLLYPVVKDPEYDKNNDSSLFNLYLFSQMSLYITYSDNEDPGEEIDLSIVHIIDGDFLKVSAIPENTDINSIDKVFLSFIRKPPDKSGFFEWESIQMSLERNLTQFYAEIPLSEKPVKSFILQSINTDGKVFYHGHEGKWIPLIPAVTN